MAARLATNSAARTVSLLSNKQVELCWDRVTVSMQMADLLILDQTLHTWLETADWDWEEIYRLSLNDCVLFIYGDDLYRFCTMVQEAVAQLPRRTVRWADVTIRLAPYTVDEVANIGCFSCN